MFIYKKNILLLTFILTSIISFSQDRYKQLFPTKLILGTNIIDDSYLLNHNFFQPNNKFSIVNYPSYFGGSFALSDDFSIGSTISLNTYKIGTYVDSNIVKLEKQYFAFDVNVYYDFSDINWNLQFLPMINPFLVGGLGLTSIDTKFRPTVNIGGGFIIWFGLIAEQRYKISIWSQIGLLVQAQGKASIEQKLYGNQIQYSLGLVYRF